MRDKELYFADKVIADLQVMTTLGDFFPRFSAESYHLFSHQALKERAVDKRHP